MAKEANHNPDEVLDEALRQFPAAQLREEKPDLDMFEQNRGFEERIRRKVRACQRGGSLFDSIQQADETGFRGPGEGVDLVGQRLGPFQITEVIGRGGMGIVYKGHDTRLDRTVAIKAMPGVTIMRFTALCGITESIGVYTQNEDRTGFEILVDGREVYMKQGVTVNSLVQSLDIELQPTDRFLTLATTDGGDSSSNDWAIFAEPVLELAAEAGP